VRYFAELCGTVGALWVTEGALRDAVGALQGSEWYCGTREYRASAGLGVAQAGKSFS
jgi:hypothetical protein